jgi:uncharacterized protein YuzE
MTVKLAGIEFENVFYDRDADVLYLHVGDPARRSTPTTPPKATACATARTGVPSASRSRTRDAGTNARGRS